MKMRLILLCLGILFFQTGYSQKKVDKHIYASSSLNFYPEFKPYSFYRTVELSRNRAILSYITQNSGTFVIDSTFSTLDDENIVIFPSPTFNIGASIRFTKDYSTFHEISLTRLSRSKSSNTNTYFITDTLGNTNIQYDGYSQKSFAMTMRYEFGKMFGYKKNRFRFGLSGFFEPSLFTYSQVVLSPQNYPIKATIFSFNVGIIPMASIQLSKKVFLDIKVAPRMLLGNYSNVTVNNPILTRDQQKSTRELDFPEIDLTGSLQIRYMIKENKKRRK